MNKLLFALLLLTAGCGPQLHTEFENRLSDKGDLPVFEWVVYGDSRPPENPIHLDLLEQINRSGQLSLIVNTGDFTDWSLPTEYDEYYGIVSVNKTPIFTVVGNHDDRLAGRQYFEHYFGPRNYAFTYSRSTFIVLQNTHIDGYGFYDYNIRWLRGQLERAKESRAIYVFAHCPTVKPFQGLMDKGYFHIDETDMEGADEFMDLMTEYDVTAVFYGHEHLYAYGQYNGVAYFITGGGGAPLHGEGEDKPWYVSDYHFLHCTTDAMGSTTVSYVGRGNILPEFAVLLQGRNVDG